MLRGSGKVQVELKTWNQNFKDEARKVRLSANVHQYVTEAESAAQRSIWKFEPGFILASQHWVMPCDPEEQ